MAAQYLVTALADTRIAFDLAYIAEVSKKGAYLPVPGTPAGLAGLTYLRGRILPIVDLSECLGIKRDQKTAESGGMNLIVAHNRTLYSFGVDAVFETVFLAPGDVLPIPPNLGSVWQRFGRGVHQREDDLMVIFDMPALLESLCAGP